MISCNCLEQKIMYKEGYRGCIHYTWNDNASFDKPQSFQKGSQISHNFPDVNTIVKEAQDTEFCLVIILFSCDIFISMSCMQYYPLEIPNIYNSNNSTTTTGIFLNRKFQLWACTRWQDLQVTSPACVDQYQEILQTLPYSLGKYETPVYML